MEVGANENIQKANACSELTTNENKMATSRTTGTKVKVNILEFMGVADTPLDLNSPLDELVSKISSSNENLTTGESDSGLDDDKATWTEEMTDSDDVMSSDGSCSDGIAGYVAEIEVDSYDLCSPCQEDDGELPVMLLKVESKKEVIEANGILCFEDEEIEDEEVSDDDSDVNEYEITVVEDDTLEGTSVDEIGPEEVGLYAASEDQEKVIENSFKTEEVSHQNESRSSCPKSTCSESTQNEENQDLVQDDFEVIEENQSQVPEVIVECSSKENKVSGTPETDKTEIKPKETTAENEDSNKICDFGAIKEVSIQEIILPVNEPNVESSDDNAEAQMKDVSIEEVILAVNKPNVENSADNAKAQTEDTELENSLAEEKTPLQEALSTNETRKESSSKDEIPISESLSTNETQEEATFKDEKLQVESTVPCTEAEDLTLKDYEMSIKDIENERRRIIGNQAVRRKTIASWISGQEPEASSDVCKPEVKDKKAEVQQVPEVVIEKIETSVVLETYEHNSVQNSAPNENTSESIEVPKPELCVQTEKTALGEVDSDSIIEKKENTKTFWENMMMAQPNESEHDLFQLESPQPDKNSLQNDSEPEFCDFQELDLNEPRAKTEPKVPVKHVPVVIHRKSRSHTVPPVSIEVMKPAMSGNIVEQEILLQQMREEEFRRELTLKSTSPEPDHKPQVIGEVYRTGSSGGSSCTSPISQTNEFTAEIVLAPPNHYRDSSDSGTFDSESVPEPKLNFDDVNEDMERDLVSPYDDKKSIDRDTSSDLGDELQCTSPSINHTGSYESLNSIGTSGSSVDFNPRKKERIVTVKPLICDDDNVTSELIIQNETPIEKEIRINREREEEMRIENKIRSMSLSKLPSRPNKDLEFNNRKNKQLDAAPKSVATNRIQQEIEEQSNRELELRTLGHVRTTSQDHVDSRTSNIYKSSNYQTLKSTNVKPVSNGTANHVQAGRRPSLPIMNKGGVSMHKFISSGGKLGVNGPFSSKFPVSNEPKPTVIYEPAAIIKKPTVNKGTGEKPVVRKSHCTAETKIQQELRQMKEREDELKRQRSRLLGLSQPNLTVIASNSNDHEVSDLELNNASNGVFKSLKERCMSNPNLADVDDTDSKPKKQVSSTAPRRRSVLIDQWESKIQIQTAVAK